MKGFIYGQSEYNIKKSLLRLDDYIKSAKESNFDFLTITDSNMHASYKFYKKCKAEGIKPVIGLEYTYTADLRDSKVLLYAQNNNGYKNIMKISSLVMTDDERNRQYTTIASIKDYLEDVVKIYVFTDSILEYLFESGNYESLDEKLDFIKKSNSYVGVSLTNRPEKFDITNDFMLYLDTKNVKYVPIHNARYCEGNYQNVLMALLQMSESNEKLSELDDFGFLSNPEESGAVDEIVNSINLDIYNDKIKLPKFPSKKTDDSRAYLRALCNKGLEKRGKYYVSYKNRLDYELSVIDKMGYNDYFLIVWDFIRYSKQNGILVGPGRGSAAGSLVAYTLGITEIDPLEYNLLFERFLNPERVTMPDIDTDFPDVKRDDVIKYVSELYGIDHVCNITAFSTFSIKSSAGDLSKILGLDKSRVDRLVDAYELLKEKGEDPYEVLLNDYKSRDKQIYDFLFVSKCLEGLPKNLTTHAAGVILSDLDLSKLIPLSKSSNGIYQSQFEASDLEEIGLLKMDFLGISNLTLIEGTMAMIPGFDAKALRNIPLDDPKVYKMLSQGDTLGVFQLESVGIRKVLRKLKPTCFEDLVAVLALYRPGPMDNIPTFIERKHGASFSYIHKDLEPILRNTYGVIVYQEQIMQIAQVFAGFSLGEADLLRRAVSKKNADKLEALQNDFVSKSVARGYDNKTALDIYSLILKFANYGFNRSHTVAYGLFAYQMAWLKVNYFKEFIANIMNTSIGDAKKTVEYQKYAKANGIKVFKPNVYVSTNKYVADKDGLYMPFNSIKSMGSTSLKIVEERKSGIFKGYDDFKQRCPFINKTQLEGLIYSGALDLFGKTKKQMLKSSSKEDELFLSHMSDGFIDNSELDFATLEEKERQVLGFNLSYNIFNNTESIKARYRAVSLAGLKYDERVNLLVVFRVINQITTKKGEPMLTGSIDDEESSVRFVVFPKTYSQLGKIEKDKLYIVNGFLKKDEREEENPPSFVINSISII